MQSHLRRREFLGYAAAAAAAGTVSELGEMSALMAADVKSQVDLPICDTHHHLWDLARFDLPWTKTPGVEKLAKSFLMPDYLQAIRGLNVVSSVYMEVDVHPSQQTKEAEYVIDLCQRGDSPMRAAVISGRPGEKAFRPYITGLAKSPFIKGVRQVLHVESTPPGTCTTPQFVEGVKLLGELKLCFDLCMRSDDLADAVKLVDLCPGTRFVLDHCGDLSVREKDPQKRAAWKKNIHELAQREHVLCKISGIVASADPQNWTPDDLAPIVNTCLQEFGPQRVMFGGDWPVCTLASSYKQWVEALRTIVRERPLAEQRLLFHDNAVKFYGLTTA